MATVHVQHEFSATPERIFAHLSEHENLNTIFPARVQRVRDGEGARNGVGSVRKLSFNGLLPFEETVLVFEPNERIEYAITKGSPMRGHHATMVFAPTPAGGTHLDYTITLGAVVPGLATIVAAALRRSVARGLDKIDESL
jgi:uncharacterized protein YndB with AHSA1/START domain